MSELEQLYQEILLDHYRRPRNFGALAGADREVDGHNPLCGDRLRLRLRLDDGTISEVRFEGSGCAISTASASMMTEAIKGLRIEAALALAGRFREAMTADADQPFDEAWGELAALQGVRAFPMRVKCATLAWHALRSALADGSERASTE